MSTSEQRPGSAQGDDDEGNDLDYRDPEEDATYDESGGQPSPEGGEGAEDIPS